MKKKIISTVLAATMIGTICSSAVMADDNVTFTIYNSKTEILTQLEEKAEEYSEAHGVNIEIYFSQDSKDTVSAHMATKYAANDPYTLSMVDAKDIYSLAPEHGIDLSDQDWVNNTDYAISIDGKVYGFPVSVEARGVIYNADAIEKIIGEKFNPEDYKTLEQFKGLLEKLSAGGMETPVGILKEDWSLAAHYMMEIYEQQDDTDAFIQGLHDGTEDLMKNEKFNSLMDTFDVLMEYNYAKDAPVVAEREVTEQKLAEGEIAFMFGGNWDWSVMNAFDYSENMGIMPIPQDTDDGTNEKLVGGGSKFFFIDSSDNTSDAQRKAAEDFLDWLVNDSEGQHFIVDDCSLIPAFSNNTLQISDPLGQTVKKYADEGKLIPNYNYMPGDFISIEGASFQKYLAGEIDRKAFASEIEEYWKNTEPIAH